MHTETQEPEIQAKKRICYKCKLEKSLEEYPSDKNKSLGKSYQCKKCHNQYAKKAHIPTKTIETMIGKKIPNTSITILKRSDDRFLYGKKRKIYSVECDCGTIKEVPDKNIGFLLSCGETNCQYSSTAKKAIESILYKDGETGFFIKNTIWNDYKRNAADRKIEFNISPEDLSKVWKRQNGKCFLTGEKLEIGKEISSSSSKSWSIDRRDSSSNYDKDNVDFVHKFVNILKNRFEAETFIQVCNAVAKTHPREPLEEGKLAHIMHEALKTGGDNCDNRDRKTL